MSPNALDMVASSNRLCGRTTHQLMIIMDGERNHSMGSPMDGTPHAVITLTIHHDQQLHAAIIQYILHQFMWRTPLLLTHTTD